MKDRLEKTNRKKKKAEINIGLHHFGLKGTRMLVVFALLKQCRSYELVVLCIMQ